MSKFGFHRHSLSLNLGATIIAFVVLLFVSSVGLLYIRSRQLVKQEALERAEKALDKMVLRFSCYLSEQEAVEENLKWITDQDQLPDSLQNFTHHFLTLSKTIDEDKPYPNSYCLILEPNDTLPDLNGEPCYVFQKTLQQTGGRIALICPERDILGSYKRLGYIIFTVLAIGLILLLIFFMRTITRFVSPLNQLVSQSQYIASGHFGEPMARTRRTDLVGQLQNSFSTMQESLAEQIGQLQQANERAEERNRELLRLNDLAQKARLEKKAFLQDVSHQIRTPLNIIQGFLNVVLKDNSDLTVREKAHIMAMMQKNAFSLRRIAYMLYDATWLEKGQKLEYNDIVSCNAVARKAIDALHRFTPGKDDTVIFETALDDDIQIRTHEKRLIYILHELLFNAKKFAPDGTVKLTVYETPGTVNFAIEDEGPGIPPEERQRIFDHFFKHTAFSEGLGLGLYLCRHYIRLMGGDLSLDTTYEKGSRFIIRLPLA